MLSGLVLPGHTCHLNKPCSLLQQPRLEFPLGIGTLPRMTANDKNTEINTWWGRHRHSHDRLDLWSIGPVELLCERRDTLWRLTWRHVHRSGSFPVRRAIGISNETSGRFEDRNDLRSASGSAGAGAGVSFSGGGNSRSSFGPTASALSRYYPADSTSLTIPSMSPNEDLIFTPTYPAGPLRLELKTQTTLAAGERLSFGFLVPLSIQVELAPAHGGSRVITEIPIHPLAKTWHGANTTFGDLAYVPSPCLTVDRWTEHKPRLDYAACPVSLVNQSGSPRSVQNLVVPTVRLALYHSPQTGFWSDTLNFDISDTQPLKLEKTFPKDAGQPVLVQGPKQAAPTSAFQRERK